MPPEGVTVPIFFPNGQPNGPGMANLPPGAKPFVIPIGQMVGFDGNPNTQDGRHFVHAH